MSVLGRFFGPSIVETFRMSYPGDWLELMNEFEMKKRGRRAFDCESTRLRLPRSFTELVSDHAGSALPRECGKVQFVRNEYFCLDSMAMKKLFEPVLKGIVKHLTKLLQNRIFQGLQFFFLVGGFAQSLLLQDKIKHEFSSRYVKTTTQCLFFIFCWYCIILLRPLVSFRKADCFHRPCPGVT